MSVFNEDIISEVWKHIPFTYMKMVSTTSKNFSYLYNNMTIEDRETAKYKEAGSLSKYCSIIIDETCKNNKYKKPHLTFIFTKYLDNYKDKYSADSYNYYLISLVFVILTHTVNRKFNKVMEIINATKYHDNNNNIATLMFLTKLITTPFLFDKNYAWYTSDLLNTVCKLYYFHLTKNMFVDKKNFRDTRELELNMFKYKYNYNYLKFTHKLPNYILNYLTELV